METTSATLEQLLAGVREFVNEELIPLEGRFSGHDWYEAEPILKEKRAIVRSHGWWLPQLSKEHGGMGLGLTNFGKLSAELGRSPFGHYVFNCQAPDAGNMEVLAEHGTPEQKEKFLEPLLSGDIRSCFSMTEPNNAGSNPLMLSTTAKLDNGEWVINGHKWFTSSADGATFAIVMVVTDAAIENPYSKASMVLVPCDNPGFEFVRNISVMGDEGSGYFSHAELKYNNCRVPEDYLLGPVGGGFVIAQQRLGPGRIHHCMRWIGIADRALDMMCRRAVDRTISPGKSLDSKQTIRTWIAESRAEIDAARLLVLDTARKIDELGDYAARIEVSTIKFYVAGVLQRVLDRAVQAHGALGLTDDTPLAMWFRHERAARVYDGPDEVHKERVARNILKDYQSPK